LSKNEITIAAPLEKVFAVLSDAESYGDWVVGAQDIRDADVEWPAAGTELHHAQGLGPFVLEDTTRVLEADPPHRLVLLARLQAFGAMRITLRLEPDGAEGTRLTIEEAPDDGVVAALRNPLSDWLLAGRNVFSLRRLKELAEQ
jgi:uncharacterized protein YndB with AHSA1/START domain